MMQRKLHPLIVLLGFVVAFGSLQIGAAEDAAPAPDTRPMAGMVSSDALVLVEVMDVGDLLGQLAASPFGQSVSQAPSLKPALNVATAAVELASMIMAGLPGTDLRDKTPRHWALVVFPLPAGADQFTPPPVGLVAELGPTGARFADICTQQIIPNLASLANGLTTERVRFGEQDALRFNSDKGQPPSYAAFTPSHLYLGNESGIGKLLAGAAQTATKLAANPRYQPQAQQAMNSGAIASAFIDLGPIMDETLNQLVEGSKQEKDTHFLGTYALQSIASWCVRGPVGFKETTVVRLDTQFEQGLIGLTSVAKSLVLQSPKLVPENYPAWVGLTLGNPHDIYREIRDLAVRVHGEQVRVTFEQIPEFFQAAFQINLERDVLDVIGPEVFVALAPRNIDAVIAAARPPLWTDFDGLFGLQVKDKGAAGDALKRFLASAPMQQQGISLATERFDDMDVTLIKHPGLAGGSLGYTFIGDFLVIGTGTETLARAARAFAKGQNLAAKEAFTEPGSLYAEPLFAAASIDARTILPKVLPKLLVANQPALQAFAQDIGNAAGAIGILQIAVRNTAAGIQIDSQSSLPLATLALTAGGGGRLAKPLAGRYEGDAREGMKKIDKALRTYRQRNGTPPTALSQLVPTCIKDLPTDPFTAGADFLYGTSADGTGWILLSVGPDGKADVDIAGYDASHWQTMVNSHDAADVEQCKRLLYRFRAKDLADESGYDDEGDIVHTGRW